MISKIKRHIVLFCNGIRYLANDKPGYSKVLFLSSFIDGKQNTDILELNLYSLIASTGIIIVFLLIIQLSKTMFKSLKHNSIKQKGNSLINGNDKAKNDEVMEMLTSREKEIYELRVSGKTNKEIAQLLNINLCTVKTHINNLHKKILSI